VGQKRRSSSPIPFHPLPMKLVASVGIQANGELQHLSQTADRHDNALSTRSSSVYQVDSTCDARRLVCHTDLPVVSTARRRVARVRLQQLVLVDAARGARWFYVTARSVRPSVRLSRPSTSAAAWARAADISVGAAYRLSTDGCRRRAAGSVPFFSRLDPRVGHTTDVLSLFIPVLCHSY